MNLKMTALGVGHGDAILLRWEGEKLEEHWTCLIDGGSSPEKLQKHLLKLGVSSLDLVVGTHPDSDHIGGLVGLAGYIKNIGSYWAPPLPAFERHQWLFGKRCQEAIRRCRSVEESFQANGIEVQYPVEGYTSAPFGSSGPRINVLSPAVRLVRHMLTSIDVSWLFASKTMPLGWILAGTDEENTDQSADLVALDRALATGALRPAELPDSIATELKKSGTKENDMARSMSKGMGIAPEFFGDSVLNNTSIVCWLEIPTGQHTHRILLPGDQENWTYLLAQHPRGLNADVFKAPHHGGRLFLEQKDAHEEVYSHIRPRVVLLSANGSHGLPHSSIRESAIRWGAAIMCTSERSHETIVGLKNEDSCCHSAMTCNKPSNNAELTLSSFGIKSDRRLCHPGFGSLPGPVVQVHQHIVNPSPLLDRLAEHELRLHVAYVKKKLRYIHEQRRKCALNMETGSKPISGFDLAALAKKEERLVLVTHLPAILLKGHERGEFWAHSTDSYRNAEWISYATPSEPEIQLYLSELCRKIMVIFPNALDKVHRDIDSLLVKLETCGLAGFADAILHFPVDTFRETFWPAVVSMLKGSDWHCYFLGNDIAFSRCPSARKLLSELVAEFPKVEDSAYYRNMYNVDSNLFPYKSSVLISAKTGNDYCGKLPTNSDLQNFLEKWLPHPDPFKAQVERLL